MSSLTTAVVCLLAWMPQASWSAVRTWTGGYFSGYWSAPANWAGNQVPQAGDDLVFPPGAAHLANTNNLGNRTFRSITISGSGYTLYGFGGSATITLTGGLRATYVTGSSTVELNLDLSGFQTFESSSSTATLQVNGDVALGSATLTVEGAGNIRLGGVVSGTGGITKNGSGVLRLEGALDNTYTGITRVNTGTLELNKVNANAMAGDLIVGNGAGSDTVRWLRCCQLPTTTDVTVNDSGILALNNYSEALGSLTLNGGAVTTGTGLLTLGGNVTAQQGDGGPATISGRLSLGPALRTFQCNWNGGSPALRIDAEISGAGGIKLVGDAGLDLLSSNSYSGLTIVAQSHLLIGDAYALGRASSGTIVSNGASLILAVSRAVPDEPLTLHGAGDSPSGALWSVNGMRCEWRGDITLAGDTEIGVVGATGRLTLSGAISGPGGLTKVEEGQLLFSGSKANTFTGPMVVAGGVLGLNKTATDIALQTPAGLHIQNGVVILWNNYQIAGNVPITVEAGGLLEFRDATDSIRDLTLKGGVATTDTGLIRLMGDLTATSAPGQYARIHGHLELSFGAHTVTVTRGPVAPDLRILAQISGTGSLHKEGDGRLALVGNNTFSGETVVNDGELWLENDNALGATGAGTTVADGASLLLAPSRHIGLEPLTLNGNGYGSLGALGTLSAGSNSWSGPITLASDTRISILGASAYINLIGPISGPGGLIKIYDGTLILSGSSGNTYGGQTWVAEGVLEMAKTSGNAVPYELVIGTDSGPEHSAIARNLRSAQCDAVTVNATGLYDVNGFTEVISTLTLNRGGDVDTGSGLLRIVGDLTVDPQISDAPMAEIAGRLEFSGAGTRTLHVLNSTSSGGGDLFELLISAVVSGTADLLKTGGGTMWLTGANTFTGELTIDEGIVVVSHSQGLGSTSGGVTVNNDATLQISSVDIGDEPLVLNSTGTPGWTALDARQNCSWAGPITLQRDTRIYVRNGTFEITGPISGTGNLRKIAGVLPGTLVFSGTEANTYNGTTYLEGGTLVLNKTVANGAIPGDLVVGDGTGGPGADVVQLQRGTQIANDADVIITSSGLLDQAGHGEAFDALSGSGTLDLGGGYLNLGLDNGSATFDGVIAGSGGRISKRGTGTQTFNGDNTYTGATTIEAGTLIVNGTQPSSAVVVRPGATLGGTGRTGLINAQGTVSPGVSPGQLTGADLNFQSGSTLMVELYSPQPGTGYDQLRALGSVALNSPILNLQAHPPYAAGDHFILIDNDGSDAVTGQFLGLPDGADLWVGGHRLRIQYAGGDGNDVELAVEGIALELAGTQILWGDGDGLVEPNECNLLNIALTNTFTGPLTGVSATLSTTTPGVRVTQDTSPYPDIPAGAVATNLLPFQLSTSPDLPCGTVIDLVLSVQTSEGNLNVPFTLPTGRLGRPERYDSDGAVLIPDMGTTNSPIKVKGFVGTLGRVEVSCFIPHSRVADLDLFLVAPDGTEVALSTGNGMFGENYGKSCADIDRTVFSDEATTPITAGTAPFIGKFRPERPLADLAGLADPNGEWALRVRDNGLRSGGTIECWSLFLSPRECGTSSGPCELCSADFAVAGALGAGAPEQTGALRMNGLASSCSAPKPCPTLQDSLPHPYAAYTFVNGASESCITVRLDSDCDVSLYTAAYLGAFNPADPCENYLGDSGSVGAHTWSFTAPADSTFVIVVCAIPPPTGCADYTLTVSGGDCQPVLHIQPATGHRVTLDWTSAAVGYQLESSEQLSSSAFRPVPTAPVVRNGKCTVTLPAGDPTRFYRLHKP